MHLPLLTPDSTPRLPQYVSSNSGISSVTNKQNLDLRIFVIVNPYLLSITIVVLNGVTPCKLVRGKQQSASETYLIKTEKAGPFCGY